MLHVWLYPANPDGVFESANWALPFVRLSLEAPDHIEPNAAKALSLASGGDAYFGLLFRLQVQADGSDVIVAEALISAARREVEQWLSQRPPGSPVTPEEMAMLADLWGRLWSDIGSNISVAARGRMNGRCMSCMTSEH